MLLTTPMNHDHTQRPGGVGARAGQGAPQTGLSLNRTVLALLRTALGLPSAAMRSSGLGRLAGGWSEAEYKRFEQAVEPFGEIDPAMWR